MTLRDRLEAVNQWLARRVHGPYICELESARERLNRDDSDYPGACDIGGCHRVARVTCETQKTSLRLCQPCTGAFQVGLFDRDVGVVTAPIERMA